MKTFFAILLGLCGVITVVAQSPSSGATALRTPEELDEIFAPIALYPDALVALILPAATVPSDIASAAEFLNANGDPAQIASQPWDESVKSLAHYPSVLKWMNENLPWTQQAGDAFSAQPSDVMQSIQQLRARAVAAGSLTDNPQQQVIMDGDDIRIVPAQPDIIYVPQYDPDLVYEDQPSFAGPWLTFGEGFQEGVWLNYDLDWDSHGIWVGQWHPGWDYRHPAWRHPGGGGPVNGHPWRPVPGRRPVRPFDANRARPEIAHPKPFPGAPVRPAQPRGAPTPSAFHPASPAMNARPDLRGYPAASQGRPVVTRPAPAPANAFNGYNRGSDTRAASQRGQMSRQQGSAPAGRSAPTPQPQTRANPGPSPSGQAGPERRKN
jgi:hypothetical protein